MITRELLDFIKTETDKGTSQDAIRQTLFKVGWSTSDLDEALSPGAPATGIIPLPKKSRTGKVVLWLSIFHLVIALFAILGLPGPLMAGGGQAAVWIMQLVSSIPFLELLVAVVLTIIAYRKKGKPGLDIAKGIFLALLLIPLLYFGACWVAIFFVGF